jgi:hypothetical protein
MEPDPSFATTFDHNSLFATGASPREVAEIGGDVLLQEAHTLGS